MKKQDGIDPWHVAGIVAGLIAVGLWTSGCTSNHANDEDVVFGPRVAAPVGAQDFCKRNPEDSRCSK